jgi:molybdopterin converting factor small subunit
VVLNKFDHKSIMYFGYYRNIIGTRVLELTEGDVETINKLYDQDLKISRDECTNQYRFDETSGLCFIKPTNGQ